ncbi:hypothetical protein [Lewinella sp. W8]|uniref:hypothetical protein n=1 Tax=Lewinella sp. W8 TaxID=2528208 RepID=UPI0010671D8C|nr:hypothetical protein [Lewinella sp. W8]MTB53553.1 hypothetical protein [Lewinella sp. W8]
MHTPVTRFICLFILLLTGLPSPITFAQCPSGNVLTLSSQEQIDAFAQTYPDCTDFSGAIVVQESVSGDIRNLSGLGNLTAINDLLIFTNDSLRDLSGLFLRVVRQDLVIQNNQSLRDLRGLDSLSALVRNFSVTNNPSLTSLRGLERLVRVMGTFTVANNPVLDTLGGLELYLFGGQLRIENNEELQSLRPMRFLRRMTQGVTIRNNPKLNDFHPDLGIPVIGGNVSIEESPLLPSLDFLSPRSIGNLSIRDCPQIADLASFDQLDAVSGSLTLAENDLLTDISAISFLNPDSLSSVVITGNPSLNACAIDVLCLALLLEEIPVVINGNGEACSSLEDLRDQCDEFPLCPYDLVIDDENSAAEFGAMFPNCEQVNGSLIINPGGRDLLPLQNVRRVRNGLRLINSDLESLDGLQGLEEIGELEVINPVNLPNFIGLESLKRIRNNLFIVNAQELTSLAGLDSLREVPNGISINQTPRLRDFNGLSQLQSTNGISIRNCVSFRSLNGLDSLRVLGGLVIDNASSMTRPGGIPLLSTVDRLIFANNSGLSSLDGLEHLDTLRLGLILIDNGQLRDIGALDNAVPGILVETGFYSLTVSGNSNLSACASPLICAMLEDPDRVSSFIADNREGCNSREQVDEACLTGVSPRPVATSLPVFPNPTTGSLSLDPALHGRPIDWRLLSITGQLLDEGASIPTAFDFSWLPKGTYFLHLREEATHYRARFVRQ